MARRASALRAVDPEPQPSSPYADPDDVEEFAEGLKDSWLHCREMNHNWRPHDVGSHPEGGWERTLRCVRCKTRRIQHLDTRGMVVSSRYEYPKGYQTEGLGRIVGEARGILRIESIKRLAREVS